MVCNVGYVMYMYVFSHFFIFVFFLLLVYFVYDTIINK